MWIVNHGHVRTDVNCGGCRSRREIWNSVRTYPPFAWKDATGEWAGWEVDLMNAVCRQLKEKCSIVEVAFEGMIPLLNGHFIDVIWSTMSITDERQHYSD
jgi:polar amino acid transport system substrate-binding protein